MSATEQLEPYQTKLINITIPQIPGQQEQPVELLEHYYLRLLLTDSDMSATVQQVRCQTKSINITIPLTVGQQEQPVGLLDGVFLVFPLTGRHL